MLFPTISFIGYAASRAQGISSQPANITPEQEEAEQYICLSLLVHATCACIYLIMKSFASPYVINNLVPLLSFMTILLAASFGNEINALFHIKSLTSLQILKSTKAYMEKFLIVGTATALFIPCCLQDSLTDILSYCYTSSYPLLLVLLSAHFIGKFMTMTEHFESPHVSMTLYPPLPVAKELAKPVISVLSISACLLPYLVQQLLGLDAVPFFGPTPIKTLGFSAEFITLTLLINSHLRDLWNFIKQTPAQKEKISIA